MLNVKRICGLEIKTIRSFISTDLKKVSIPGGGGCSRGRRKRIVNKESHNRENLSWKMKRRSSSSSSKKENISISPQQQKTKKLRKVAKYDDPNKPKKPPTAFFYFLEDFRSEYQAQNPNVKQMRDVGKACGEKWNTMKYEEKVKYYDIATEKRAEFDKAMAEYEKNKVNDIDDDSDF